MGDFAVCVWEREGGGSRGCWCGRSTRGRWEDEEDGGRWDEEEEGGMGVGWTVGEVVVLGVASCGNGPLPS